MQIAYYCTGQRILPLFFIFAVTFHVYLQCTKIAWNCYFKSCMKYDYYFKSYFNFGKLGKKNTVTIVNKPQHLCQLSVNKTNAFLTVQVGNCYSRNILKKRVLYITASKQLTDARGSWGDWKDIRCRYRRMYFTTSMWEEQVSSF